MTDGARCVGDIGAAATLVTSRIASFGIGLGWEERLMSIASAGRELVDTVVTVPCVWGGCIGKILAPPVVLLE